MIPMSPGEVVDRWSILFLKVGKDESFRKEFRRYNDEVLTIMAENPLINSFVQTIIKTNAQIWELEADIRSGKIPDTELMEIGHRAVQIRDHNKIRVQAKGDIDKIFGFCPDKKINHRSE